MEGLILEREIFENQSVSLSPTLSKSDKVEHHIRMETYKPIALRFWVKCGVVNTQFRPRTINFD